MENEEPAARKRDKNMNKRVTVTFPLTLLEKMVRYFRLPSKMGILFIALLIGPLGNFLYLYSVSADPIGSFIAIFVSFSAGESGHSDSFPMNYFSLASNLLWYGFLFYVAFLPGIFRSRLTKTEKELVSLSPKGSNNVQKSFEIISKALPQLGIAAIFLFVYATAIPDLWMRGELNILSFPVYILRSLFRSLLFGSVLWFFLASLYALYRFGKNGLKLKRYNEDPMLGTKKMGSLSFSLSVLYFFGLGLFASQSILGEIASSQSVLVNLLAMLFLIPIGIVFFMAPLVSTHNKLVEAKKIEVAVIGKRISELIDKCAKEDQEEDEHMIKLLTLENIEKKVNAIKTWPIESPVLGKLTLILLSVTATIIARIIQIGFNI